MGFGLVAALSSDMVFDALAIRLNAPKAGGLRFSMGWHFTDRQEHWRVELVNGALHALQVDAPPTADVSLTLARTTLDALLQQTLQVPQAVAAGQLQIAGQAALMAQFFALLDRFTMNFPVVDAAPWPDA